MKLRHHRAGSGTLRPAASLALLAWLTLLTLAAAAPPAARGAAAPGRATVAASLEELATAGEAVDRAHGPVRRGAPADPAAWARLDTLRRAVAELADAAESLREHGVALREASGGPSAVGAAAWQRRLAAADSLIAHTRAVAAASWRDDLPADPQEARGRVTRHAHELKRAAERSATAAADLAYAVGVTEGVQPRTLALSLVGLVVVFVVLALIALVVAVIRRVDDGWQAREAAAEASALVKDPTIDATTVVLIAAACATVITGRHRVRRIRRLLSPAQKRTPWSAQGRLILQGSHTVDRKAN